MSFAPHKKFTATRWGLLSILLLSSAAILPNTASAYIDSRVSRLPIANNALRLVSATEEDNFSISDDIYSSTPLADKIVADVPVDKVNTPSKPVAALPELETLPHHDLLNPAQTLQVPQQRAEAVKQVKPVAHATAKLLTPPTIPAKKMAALQKAMAEASTPVVVPPVAETAPQEVVLAATTNAAPAVADAVPTVAPSIAPAAPVEEVAKAMLVDETVMGKPAYGKGEKPAEVKMPAPKPAEIAALSVPAPTPAPELAPVSPYQVVEQKGYYLKPPVVAEAVVPAVPEAAPEAVPTPVVAEKAQQAEKPSQPAIALLDKPVEEVAPVSAPTKAAPMVLLPAVEKADTAVVAEAAKPVEKNAEIAVVPTPEKTVTPVIAEAPKPAPEAPKALIAEAAPVAPPVVEPTIEEKAVAAVKNVQQAAKLEANVGTIEQPKVTDTPSIDNTVWSAQSGDTLHAVLKEWCHRTGVQLVWQTEFDYPLATSINIRGDFPTAVRTLLRGFFDASPQPFGRLHRQSNFGQAVLIIGTRGNSYKE